LVAILTHFTESLGRLEATIDFTDSSPKFKVRKALNTVSSIVFQAAIGNFLAVVVFCSKEAALACIASIIVVGFAVGDDTLIVL